MARLCHSEQCWAFHFAWLQAPPAAMECSGAGTGVHLAAGMLRSTGCHGAG